MLRNTLNSFGKRIWHCKNYYIQRKLCYVYCLVYFKASFTFLVQNSDSKDIWSESEVPEGSEFDVIDDPRPQPE